MRLVFVCSGNTCRSPLALAAWHVAVRHLTAAAPGLRLIEATSAGLCASPGAKAARYSQEIALEWGADLSEHRAQLFRPEHAKFDLIVTMTRDQVSVLRSHFETAPSQVRLLGAYAPVPTRGSEMARLRPLWGSGSTAVFAPEIGAESDILDPYGASLEAYQACAAQIRRCIEEFALVLCNSLEKGTP